MNQKFGAVVDEVLMTIASLKTIPTNKLRPALDEPSHLDGSRSQIEYLLWTWGNTTTSSNRDLSVSSKYIVARLTELNQI
jgi:hypothetical protein